jgi:hypothetical protein
VDGLVCSSGGGGGSARAAHGGTVVGSSKPNRRWRTHSGVVDGGLLTVELRRGEEMERGREKFGGKMVWGRNGYRMTEVGFQNQIFILLLLLFFFF